MAHSAASRIGILRSRVLGGTVAENPYEDLERRAAAPAVPKNWRRFIILGPLGLGGNTDQNDRIFNSATKMNSNGFSDFRNYRELS
jgi:hypothetical protein